VTCANAGDTLEVEIHAWDEAGNHDFAVADMIVQDNGGVCDEPAGAGQIAGGIATESDRRVNEVEVRLSGDNQRVYMTNATGTYAFMELAEDSDYTVIPSKNGFAENGITTFDLILIQNHILGERLPSPYKQVAADVNRDGNISTLDVILLRKLVLGIDTEFSNNTSWRFVDASFRFPVPSDAFVTAFPEVININNLVGSYEASFVAIKTGDVNESASAYVQPRSNEVFTIQAESTTRLLAAGEDYRIGLSAEELSKVQGYQFSLELEGVELIDIEYASVQAEHLGVFAEEGLITASWNGQADREELFTLVVRPTAEVMLEDVLRISSRKTAAEAYNAADEIMDIRLEANATALEDNYALYQNVPNPYQSETQIGFRLAEAGRAVIKVRDVTGRLVKLVEGDYGRGEHQIRIKRNELPSAGVYYYTLESGEYMATRKMILLE
jgi:hypothetical protein